VLLVPHHRRRSTERLLASAAIKAAWAEPPLADEIRMRDRERLRQDTTWAEEFADDDRAFARSLLAERSPEDIAAALVRLHRARLPEPEELLDSGAERTPDRPRLASHDMVWFRMNIGRDRNADPRWLLPLICRRGHVTKREIGGIRVFDHETKFEIARHAADRFASLARRSDHQDGNIRIEAIRAGSTRRHRETKPPAEYRKSHT
jgi:ATP-dependent RNA helicase DeaD